MNGAFKRYQLDGCSPLKATWMCTLKCLKRALILYLLNFLINRSQSFETMRILGGSFLPFPLSFVVLAYFSVSGLINSLVLLYTPVWYKGKGFISRWSARSTFKDDPNVRHMFFLLNSLCF